MHENKTQWSKQESITKKVFKKKQAKVLKKPAKKSFYTVSSERKKSFVEIGCTVFNGDKFVGFLLYEKIIVE